VKHRLGAWVTLVSVLAALNYAARAAGETPPKNILYHWDNAIGGAIQFLVLLGLALLIARGRRDLLALRRPRSWRGALGRALLILGGLYALSAALTPILHPGREQGLTPDHWDSARAAQFFANALVVCVLAPFTEEILFRGIGYGLIAERFGVDSAIVGSALFFGLAHGLVQALPLLVAFGIGLAWLRENQDSTVPGMILHGSFNAIALAAALAT
jgi:membrane protease YdiL (CAAX protease family)